MEQQTYTEFLPISRADMEARGWDQLDFVVVGGDAYVDHPSFGTAIISRLLEAEGYKVGVLAQPRYSDCEDFKRFGRPKYGFFIGGGNVAMDVARSAVRCGAEKVSIVYRRRICDMTAQDAEIAGAQAEGCEVLELTAPLAIETGEDGRVSGLRVQPQIIGEPRRGRPAPRAAATPERVIPCERVFVAIGQDIDSKPFEDMGIACKWGCVVTDSDGAVPNFDGLFSGGDCQTGPATVIRAINAGRVASANIDRYLGFDHKIKLDGELPTVQFKGKHECGRCELGEREAGERIHDWNLVEQGLTEEEARQEASRCLRCDHFGFGAFRGGRNLEW